MYQARYYKTDGTAGSEITLPLALFDGVVNEAALHQTVKAYLANQRQGTAQKKNRAAVAGGSRKPWRQKGTGRARQGTIRAAQWSGGGRAFPPQAHSWRQRVPKRVRALARRSAFNSRAEAGRVVVIEGFDFESPKTQQLTQLLGMLELEGKVLLLTDGVNRNVHLSGRNLQGVQVLPFGTESPYDVIWSGTVVIEESALKGVDDGGAPSSRERRRPLDREALKAEADAQAARKQERQRRPERTRRVRGDEIASGGTAATVAAPKKAPKDTAGDVPRSDQAASVDAAAVALPKVSELADFLATITDPADVEVLRDRDTRKTAAALYETRLAELSGESGEEEE